MPEKSTQPNHTVFVIAHTHWDREWYATFQQFRVRLVHMLDELLDLLEREPTYTHFNLDGQTVILQDYLEIRPEKRETLQKLIREGRLGVGPWYVLADEFLVSGEALVRNLQLGHRIAGEFGRVQKVGYIPDAFGHISQMPQILRGFNIPYAMHFRGLDEGDLRSELWWESPDGSRVLLRHLPTNMGYGNASSLGASAPEAAADLLAAARYETQRAASSILLAMNGMDHISARADLPGILQVANGVSEGMTEFRQGSLEEYFSHLSGALDGCPLQVVKGELRDASRTPGRDNRLLPHVLSSRIYLKQKNERIQNLLELWAEPWSAIAWLEGNAYPSAFLWKAWEWLLQNHPHDSICGCSIDAVHSQMETRFTWASEIAEEVLSERFELIARGIDLSDLKDDEAALVVFNTLPWETEGAVSVEIDLWDAFLDQVAMLRWKPLEPESDIPATATAPERYQRRIRKQWWDDRPVLPNRELCGLRLRPLGENKSLPVQIESIGRSHILRPFVSGPASERSATRVKAAFMTSLPACGYRVYAVAPADKPVRLHPAAHSANILENEYLRVEINPNGTFSLKDKTSGNCFEGLGYFEDGGDSGDEYNYSAPLQERLENTLGLSTRISRLASGPVIQRCRIDYEWPLPEGLDAERRTRSEKRLPCKLSVVLSLPASSPVLSMEVTFENLVRDHRLRMVFPSDVNTDRSQASAVFDVVDHPIQVTPVTEDAWVEDAPSTFPQKDWVDFSDGKRGLCLINRGLPEYEVLDTERRELALTLLRAVGYLGASKGLLSAAGAAGPNIATPEGQVTRTLTYQLALLPHTGTWDSAEVWRHALAQANPARTLTTGMVKNQPVESQPEGASSRSFLSIEGRNVILSAVKKAEQGEALILRLFNPSEEYSQAIIRLPFVPGKISRVGMDEQPQAAKGVKADPVLEPDGMLRLTLLPKEILTIKLER